MRDGHVLLQVDRKNDYGHAIAKADAPGLSSALTVPAISIPSLLKELGWERIGLLKIDIEGHERVLLGQDCDWLTRVDAICIECHEAFGEGDLQRLAARYGFAPPQRLPGIWFMGRAIAG